MNASINILKGGATLVQREGEVALADFSVDEVMKLCESAGVVLFRGFDTCIDQFSSFVEKNSSRVTLDPARKFHADNAQKVDAGTDPVGLHCENGNAPKLPHFIWFYCKKAASSGSQTTYCDGKGVWGKLSADTKRIFSEQKIKYSRTVPEQLWKSYLAYEIPNISSPEEVEVSHLKMLSDQVSGQSFTLNDDMSVHYEFVVGAAHETVFSDQLVFANSILGPSFNYEKPKITLEDNTEIPADVLAEIEQVTSEETQEINWQDGDIVMIDNTRFMHGRRAIEDPIREIYAALSYR